MLQRPSFLPTSPFSPPPLILRVPGAATKVWTNVISGSQERPGVRASGSACVIPGNRMLVYGGYDGSEFLQDLWVLHTGEAARGMCGVCSVWCVPLGTVSGVWVGACVCRLVGGGGEDGGGGPCDRVPVPVSVIVCISVWDTHALPSLFAPPPPNPPPAPPAHSRWGQDWGRSISPMGAHHGAPASSWGEGGVAPGTEHALGGS